VFSVVLVLSHQLWCHIGGRAAKDFMLLISALGINCESSKAKVNDLNHLCFFFDQNIVKLNIAMCNSIMVQVLKRLRDLLEKSAACLFLDLPTRRTVNFDIMMHTNSIYKVCDDAYLLISFNQIMHFNTIWMINFP
jgi:hypothetical protein